MFKIIIKETSAMCGISPKLTIKKRNTSSVKWSVLAHLKSQPREQNFQAQI